MSEDLCLGIDLGTTSVKVCLISIKNESVISTVSESADATLISDVGALGSEQDTAVILKTLQKCMGQISLDHRERVKCIAVSGQMHGIMLWTKTASVTCGGESSDRTKADHLDSGRSSVEFIQDLKVKTCSQLFTWQDQRCSPEFLATLPNPISHFPVSTGHGCATLFWLIRHNPGFISSGNYTNAGTIMDYLVWLLCGLDKTVMTVQNANSWGYFNNKDRKWNRELLRDARFPVHLLPDIVEPGSMAGKLQFNWCGMKSGIPILAALGDLQCYVYSALKRTTDAVLNLSTSSQVAFAVQSPDIPDKPDSTKPVQFFPYFQGGYIAVAASLNGGNVLSQFVDMLVKWSNEFGATIDKEEVWTKLLQMASDPRPSSSKDPKILPTIYGERHAPLQTATITGLTCDNLDLGSIFRSMCSGLLDNLCNMMSPSYLQQHGITRLIGTGSVITRNQIVKQEVQKHYGKLDISFGDSCDSAFGVALNALRCYKSK